MFGLCCDVGNEAMVEGEKKVNVTHPDPGAVGGVTTLGPGALSGAVNNYWHCHYRPSLNSLRLFRVAGIYRRRPRWAGGVTNVSEMNVFCDRRRYRCLTLFCFGSSRGAPQRRRQMASLGGGAPSPVPTQWLPAGLAASGPGLNV